MTQTNMHDVDFILNCRGARRALQSRLQPGEITVEALGAALGELMPDLPDPMDVARQLMDGCQRSMADLNDLSDLTNSGDGHETLRKLYRESARNLFREQDWDPQQQRMYLIDMLTMIRTPENDAETEQRVRLELNSYTNEKLLTEYTNEIVDRVSKITAEDLQGDPILRQRVENIEASYGIQEDDRQWSAEDQMILNAASMFMVGYDTDDKDYASEDADGEPVDKVAYWVGKAVAVAAIVAFAAIVLALINFIAPIAWTFLTEFIFWSSNFGLFLHSGHFLRSLAILGGGALKTFFWGCGLVSIIQGGPKVIRRMDTAVYNFVKKLRDRNADADATETDDNAVVMDTQDLRQDGMPGYEVGLTC